MKKKKEITVTINDINRTPWLFNDYRWDNVSVEKITEKLIPDDACFAFSCFLEENGIKNDYLVTDSLGYLTFHCKVDLSDEDLVNGINNVLKEMKL